MLLRTRGDTGRNELYRIFSPHSKQETKSPCILYWYKRHPVQAFTDGTTFAKHKLSLLEGAVSTAKIDYDRFIDPEAETTSGNATICHLPRCIWIYNIIGFLGAKDILSLARTCKVARAICIDNIVWRNLCFRTFENPNLFKVDSERSHYWRSIISSEKSVKDKLNANYWRLVFIVMHDLERTNSVVHTRRLSECSGSSRCFRVPTKKGTLQFTGVPLVSCIEFVVYNYELHPWHRKSFKGISPWDCKELFADVGLVMTKMRRKVGPLRKPSFALYTDLGARVDLNQYFQPIMNFKAYKSKSINFKANNLLLCQNFLYSGGKYSDEFVLYEVTLIG